MAIFSFKLKTLHRLKAQLEDQAKNRFGQAVAALNAEIMKLDQIKAAIAATVDEFRKLSGGRFTAGRIKEFNYYITVLKERAALQEIAVQEATHRVNIAREALILAARQREMYDKLREKAFMRHMDEEKRAEHRLTDELVSYRGNTMSII